MFQQTIGIVGGFGGYATLNFYKRILETFATECEINYPRIVMDNNFAMPSRTRALLYDENIDIISDRICDSIRILEYSGADKIVMVCGTAHYFYEDIIKKVPTAQDKLINIIESTSKALNREKVKKVAVIAAEGALKKNLYNKYIELMGKEGIVSPSENDYDLIRYFIEAVKQNKIDDEIKSQFRKFVDNLCKEQGIKNIVLGCTEFPILCKHIDGLDNYKFWDPLEIVLQELKETLI